MNIEIDNLEPIEFSTDKNIRMLEQLNRTLELIQSNNRVDENEESQRLRHNAEMRVLECIAMICTPLVGLKETSPGFKAAQEGAERWRLMQEQIFERFGPIS